MTNGSMRKNLWSFFVAKGRKRSGSMICMKNSIDLSEKKRLKK